MPRTLRNLCRESACRRTAELSAFCFLLAVTGTAALHAAQLGPAPAQKGAIHRLVAALLRNPARLRLPEPGHPRATFFFKVQLRVNRPPDSCSLLAASDKGKAAVVVYGENGMPYAYLGPGLLAFVDANKPGQLDVFRGVSASLLAGGTKFPGKRHPSFAVALIPVSGKSGAVGLDLSPGLLRLAVRQAARTSYNSAERMLVLSTGNRRLLIALNPEGAKFAVRMVSASTPAGALVVSDVTPGKLPIENLFRVTLDALRASGQPVRTERYHPGEKLPWFPHPGFGSNRGEVLASEALQRLMPVEESRVNSDVRRSLRKQIADLRGAEQGGQEAGDGLLPMIRIFHALEWGADQSVDNEAERTLWRNGHPAYADFSWDFNRNVYHKVLKRKWGGRLIGHLINTLASVAVHKGGGLTRKLLAVDLLSDIGPGRADRDWARNSRMVSKVFAGHSGNREMGQFLLGLIRARWGVPLAPQQIAAAKRLLSDVNANIPLRVRALEILCFTNELPDDRDGIAELEKAYLADPRACIASPVAGRYLYDLAVCRTGREILLDELENRRSILSGQPLLASAAFMGALPGSPGFNMAVGAARRIAGDAKYSPAIRNAALGMLAIAPIPVFRKVMLEQLGEHGGHFGTRMQMMLTSRKAVGDFLPQLAGLYARGSSKERVRIMLAIGFGFPRMGDANPSLPVVRSALESSDSAVRWSGVECVCALRYTGAKLDATSLYPAILAIVENDFKGRVGRIADSLDCFSLATGERWHVPPSGMLPDGQPNLQPNSGMIWWRQHYADVRESALEWAAKHPPR